MFANQRQTMVDYSRESTIQAYQNMQNHMSFLGICICMCVSVLSQQKLKSLWTHYCESVWLENVAFPNIYLNNRLKYCAYNRIPANVYAYFTFIHMWANEWTISRYSNVESHGKECAREPMSREKRCYRQVSRTSFVLCSPVSKSTHGSIELKENRWMKISESLLIVATPEKWIATSRVKCMISVFRIFFACIFFILHFVLSLLNFLCFVVHLPSCRHIVLISYSDFCLTFSMSFFAFMYTSACR